MLLLFGILLVLVQFVSALPWLVAFDPRSFKALVRKPAAWGITAAVVVGLGLSVSVFLMIVRNADALQWWGRLYGSILHAQWTADLFVFLFVGLLVVWPRGGAVALAAFREGIRQPWFWLLIAAGVVLLLFSLVIPYFTFGDDTKMMKQLGYDIVMLLAVAFGVIAAGQMISDEIEGRTAVTLMSKPLSRRQFLLGKFVGILLAALAMTGLLGWFLDWAMYLKPLIDFWDEPTDQLQLQIQPWIVPLVEGLLGTGLEPSSFLRGTGLWLADALTVVPGLIIGFCQVMILLAIASALATRLPMVVNLGTCLLFFFLGHLAPVLVQTAQRMQRLQGTGSTTLDMVGFMARLFDTLLPALEFFNLGPAIIRDSPLEAFPFFVYVGSVAIYAILYTAIAMLIGLILFEDRDLA